MELFNKGERTIDGLKPQTSAVFDDLTAERLLGLYGSEIIKASEAKVISSDEDIQAFVDKLELEVADLRAEIVELKKGDKTKLKAEIAKLQEIADSVGDKDAMIASLNAEIALLNASQGE